MKGVTGRYKIRHEEIRKSFGVERLSNKCRGVRLGRFGHISRRTEDYVESKVTKMVVGKRKRGRPRKRWEDAIKEKLGLVKEDAMDRASQKKKNVYQLRPRLKAGKQEKEFLEKRHEFY